MPQVDGNRPRVIVAGGGVAALEALLALHELAGRRIRLALLAPGTEFLNRPASVAEPFGLGGPALARSPRSLAHCDAELIAGMLAAVEAGGRIAVTGSGPARVRLARRRRRCAACARRAGRDHFLRPAGRTGARQPCSTRPRVVICGHRVRDFAGRRVDAAGLRARRSWPRRAAQAGRRRGGDHRRHARGVAARAVRPRRLRRRRGTARDRGIHLLSGRVAAIHADHCSLSAAPRSRPTPSSRCHRCRDPGSRACPRTSTASSRWTQRARTGCSGRVRGRRRDVVPGQAGRPRHPAGRCRGGGDRRGRRRAARRAAVSPGPARPAPDRRGAALSARRAARGRRPAEPAGRCRSGMRGEVSTRALWWPPGKVAGRYLAPYLATARPVKLGREPLVDRAATARSASAPDTARGARAGTPAGRRGRARRRLHAGPARARRGGGAGRGRAARRGGAQARGVAARGDVRSSPQKL